MIRMNGDLKKLDHPALTPDETHALIYDMMNDAQRKNFEEKRECDFSFELGDIARFRVNVFVQGRGLGAVFRTIPTEILPLEKLGMPPILRQLCDREKGLILVTGTTGSHELLTRLEQSNVFLASIDDEQHWYRYHHLFGDLLRKRLLTTHGEEVPGLHSRASKWFESNGYLREAILHALDYTKGDRAVALRPEMTPTVAEKVPVLAAMAASWCAGSTSERTRIRRPRRSSHLMIAPRSATSAPPRRGRSSSRQACRGR